MVQIMGFQPSGDFGEQNEHQGNWGCQAGKSQERLPHQSRALVSSLSSLIMMNRSPVIQKKSRSQYLAIKGGETHPQKHALTFSHVGRGERRTQGMRREGGRETSWAKKKKKLNYRAMQTYHQVKCSNETLKNMSFVRILNIIDNEEHMLLR